MEIDNFENDIESKTNLNSTEKQIKSNILY